MLRFMKESKNPSESRVALTQMMQPEHANPLGNVHGGYVLKMIDEAAGIAAARHSRKPCVTAEIDSVSFRAPVHVGNLVEVEAKVTRSWTTSMEIRAIVTAEDLLTGERTTTSVAYLVYVGIDWDGKPTPVPELIPESDDERQMWEMAGLRRDERLARRERENGR